MKNIIRISALLMSVTAILFTGCGNKPKPAVPVTVEPTGAQIIKNGEYLVNIMGCNDCHSPKQVGPQGPVVISELMLSGYPSDRQLQKVDAQVLKTGWVLMNEDLTAAAGPWGVSFSANLTSDQTGIGQWTEENFKRALKEGKYMGLEGGRTLLPPMPWTDFAYLTDEDVKAIFNYLQSTKPVKNVPPLPIAPEEISK
jgi:mono/diheme cytochrome c family protein